MRPISGSVVRLNIWNARKEHARFENELFLGLSRGILIQARIETHVDTSVSKRESFFQLFSADCDDRRGKHGLREGGLKRA